MFAKVKRIVLSALFFASLSNFVVAMYLLYMKITCFSELGLKCAMLFSIAYGAALGLAVVAWKD